MTRSKHAVIDSEHYYAAFLHLYEPHPSPANQIKTHAPAGPALTLVDDAPARCSSRPPSGVPPLSPGPAPAHPPALAPWRLPPRRRRWRGTPSFSPRRCRRPAARAGDARPRRRGRRQLHHHQRGSWRRGRGGGAARAPSGRRARGWTWTWPAAPCR